MVSYLFLSIILAVLGLAAVITAAAMALPRARRQRELARRRRELAGQEELEDYIRRVNQALSDEDIDRLNDERGDG
jgi:hypothetical protein